jgi:general secretion pathway protein D
VLNHASADNLAGILRELYTTDKNAPTIRPGTATSPAPRSATQRQPAGEPQTAAPVIIRPDVGGGESGVSGKVKVVPDKDTNSLIIQTAPWNYPTILETIRKLDKRPDQVLIEVTIAEIRLDDEDDFGVEWSLLSQGTVNAGGETFNVNATTQNVYNKALTVGQSMGFSYMVSQAGRLTAVLNAYAKASKLNIISRPHIIAIDNKEAKIDVGQEVPVITTQTRAGDGDTTQEIDQTIEYRSTGIILTVTPHINDDREVTLDVNQEVSEAQKNLLGGTDSPIILKRSAKTTMVVRDNETLIIGGLMQETKERSREGIPWLSKIPFLGYLFGVTKDAVSKTELVVLMTPRIIATIEEGRKQTDDFLSGTIILKKGLIAR